MLCYVINKMSLLITIALFCFKLTFHFLFFFCYIKQDLNNNKKWKSLRGLFLYILQFFLAIISLKKRNIWTKNNKSLPVLLIATSSEKKQIMSCLLIWFFGYIDRERVFKIYIYTRIRMFLFQVKWIESFSAHVFFNFSRF